MATDLETIAYAICASNKDELHGRVGAGAFKETFHVSAPGKGSKALKIYRPGHPTERSDREIEAMKRCGHPNIAKLDTVTQYEYEGVKYLVTWEEFLPGGTLYERVARCGLLTSADAREIAIPLVSGLSHIAAHHLVHRDLKPENVLFREDRRTPVIVDFGLVRDLAGRSLTKSWLIRGPGTPFFSPPEQLLNEKELIDWRSDQFSLAVLLSVCTFGFHPYAHEDLSDGEIVDLVARRAPPAPRFVEAARNSGMGVLVKMAAAWPAGRFRRPDILERAWRS